MEAYTSNVLKWSLSGAEFSDSEDFYDVLLKIGDFQFYVFFINDG